MTPSGIKPATFPVVVQCLNQLRHHVPPTLLTQENEWWSKCCAYMLQPNNNAIQFNSLSTGLYYNNNNNYYYCCDYYNYSFIGVAVKSKVKVRVQRTPLGALYPFLRKHKKKRICICCLKRCHTWLTDRTFHFCSRQSKENF
jgi:hypothetical protein